MTRFYGLPPMTLATMPQWLLHIYAEQIREIESEEMLERITAATFPHADEAARGRVWRQLSAYAGYEEPKQALDPATQGGQTALAGLGIGLHIDSSQETDADA